MRLIAGTSSTHRSLRSPTRRDCCPRFHQCRRLRRYPAARRYLAPLIVGEAYPPFKNGLPDYVKLRNVAAPKKLNTEFAV